MTSSRLVFSEDLSASVATCTSVVRVKNLRSIIAGPHDAWGRSSRPQPFTISASVGFQSSFTSSSSTDHLSEDTVHYGLLAKAILAILNRIAQEPKDRSLRDVLDTMWIDLSGFDTFGVPQQPVGGQPFLNVATISSLEIVADLPKASLLGDGISIATAASFQCIDGVVVVSARTQSLKLRELRVPTLIGVNSNERLAKQVVIANLEIEGLDDTGDTFCLLEDVLVKVSTSSNGWNSFLF